MKHLDLYSLIAVNIVTILMAVVFGWSIASVMYIYWWQSVIIGVFTVVKILNLPSYLLKSSPEAKKMLAEHGPIALAKTFNFKKRLLAGFFIVHYGIFHLVYFVFLNAYGYVQLATSTWTIVLPILLFFGNHWYSYYKNYVVDKTELKNPQEMIDGPYRRIIPMHLTIILGGFVAAIYGEHNVAILMIFMLLKMTVDIFGHLQKHKAAQPLVMQD